MEKSSTSPLVRCLDEVPGYEERKNDVVFCGSDAQQHVVFFPGDVQVRSTDFVVGSVRLKTPKNTWSEHKPFNYDVRACNFTPFPISLFFVCALSCLRSVFHGNVILLSSIAQFCFEFFPQSDFLSSFHTDSNFGLNRMQTIAKCLRNSAYSVTLFIWMRHKCNELN